MKDRTQTVRVVVRGDARITQSFLGQSLWPWISQRLAIECVGLSFGPTGGTLMAQGAYATPPFDLADLKFRVIGELLSNPEGFFTRPALPRWTFLLALTPECSPVLDTLRFDVKERPDSDEVEVQVSIRSRSEGSPPAPEVEWWSRRLADPETTVRWTAGNARGGQTGGAGIPVAREAAQPPVRVHGRGDVG